MEKEIASMNLSRDIAAGTAGGLAGGLVMTAFMLTAKHTPMLETPLPVKVERWTEDQLSIEERPTGVREEGLAQGGIWYSRPPSVPLMAH
jgi:hypothetical protein